MAWFENKKILVPVDFSELSYQAVDTTIEMKGDSSITVLYVLEATEAYEIAARYVDDIDDQHSKHALSSLRERFPNHEYPNVSLATIVGDPAHSIAEFAESKNF